MDSAEQKSKIPLSIAIGGACSLLFTLACIGALLVVVIGGLLRGRGAEGGARLSPPERAIEGTARQERSLGESQIPTTALLKDLRGWVEVQDEAGSWFPAQDGQTVAAGQRVRTGELSEATLQFYDGSQASLLAGSELFIDQLNAPGAAAPRTIVLTQAAGESSHQVVSNPAEGSLYRVNTPAGQGEAKGTTFTVRVTPEQRAYYTVVEGVVAVTSMDVTVLVNAGEFTTLYFGQPPHPPLVSITMEGLLVETGETWTVADQTFAVHEATVITGSPQPGDWVYVRGHWGPDGAKIADWIILLYASPANRFSITGVVEAMGEEQWTVNGQTILIGERTEWDEKTQVGDLVRVEGVILEDGQLQAASITRVSPPEGMPFSFMGVLEERGENTWVISGITILVDEGAHVEDGLAAGMVVRVSGWIREDGRWQAARIVRAADSSRGFAFTGVLEQIDPWVAAGIAFEVRDWTLVDEGLKVGMLVRVEGEITPEGVWVAGKVERIGPEDLPTLILVGTVISVDPWVISGIPLVVTDATRIIGQISPGTLVRVHIQLAPDGTWQVLSIQALERVGWFPGCMDIVATITGVSGNQIQMLNWPALTLAEGAQVEGDLTPHSVVRLRLCFTTARIIEVRYIIILIPGEVEIEIPEDDGARVTICHKPGKKGGGKTMTISRAALGGHLGHGDYVGACR